MLRMKVIIQASYQVMGSRAQYWILLSKDLDLFLFQLMRVGFSEIELFLLLLGSMLVMSLPKTLLLIGKFLILQSIVILANQENIFNCFIKLQHQVLILHIKRLIWHIKLIIKQSLKGHSLLSFAGAPEKVRPDWRYSRFGESKFQLFCSLSGEIFSSFIETENRFMPWNFSFSGIQKFGRFFFMLDELNSKSSLILGTESQSSFRQTSSQNYSESLKSSCDIFTISSNFSKRSLASTQSREREGACSLSAVLNYIGSLSLMRLLGVSWASCSSAAKLMFITVNFIIRIQN